MNLYFDCEFTGLHKNTTLISLGIISEDGKTFYAEFDDYNESQVDAWIQKNVIDKLLFEEPQNGEEKYYVAQRMPNNPKCTNIYDNYSMELRSCKEEIEIELNIWLKQFGDIQFVSDVCHYDFVLLIDLISGHALTLPNNIGPYCHDINQDIAKYYNISDKKAFNVNREKIVKEFTLKQALKNDNINKHNALWDAKIIKAIYDKINNKKEGIKNEQNN